MDELFDFYPELFPPIGAVCEHPTPRAEAETDISVLDFSYTVLKVARVVGSENLTCYEIGSSVNSCVEHGFSYILRSVATLFL